MGQTLLIAPGRGYAVTGDGELRLLAAFDDDGASDLLRAVLARAGGGEGDRLVDHVEPAVGGARLRRGRAGAERRAAPCSSTATSGAFTPYLPSGAFL